MKIGGPFEIGNVPVVLKLPRPTLLPDRFPFVSRTADSASINSLEIVFRIAKQPQSVHFTLSVIRWTVQPAGTDTPAYSASSKSVLRIVTNLLASTSCTNVK